MSKNIGKNQVHYTKPNNPNNPMLLGQASSELAYPLTKLLSLSFQSSTVPNQRKIANVTPVYEKGSANTAINYRPISLLSVLGKCKERCSFKYNSLYNFLHLNNILTPCQSGFRPKDSSVNQLLSIYSEFYRAIDQGKEIRVRKCFRSTSFSYLHQRPSGRCRL